MLCRPIILCLLNCSIKTIQVTEGRKTFFEGRMFVNPNLEHGLFTSSTVAYKIYYTLSWTSFLNTRPLASLNFQLTIHYHYDTVVFIVTTTTTAIERTVMFVVGLFDAVKKREEQHTAYVDVLSSVTLILQQCGVCYCKWVYSVIFLLQQKILCNVLEVPWWRM